MGLLRNTWLWVAGVGVLISGGLLLVLVGYVAVVVFAGLVSGAPLVPTLLDLALPVLGGTAALFVLLVVSAVGGLWVLVSNVSLPRSRRLAALLGRLERACEPLGLLGLSELVGPPEPSAEERAERALARLKQQYVDGAISEAEFERKVDRLVSTDSVDDARADRDRRWAREAETDVEPVAEFNGD